MLLTSDRLATACDLPETAVHGLLKVQALGPEVAFRDGHAWLFHEEAVGVVELRKALITALGEQASIVGDLVRAATPHIVRMWRDLTPLTEIVVKIAGHEDVDVTIRPSFIRKAKARAAAR